MMNKPIHPMRAVLSAALAAVLLVPASAAAAGPGYGADTVQRSTESTGGYQSGTSGEAGTGTRAMRRVRTQAQQQVQTQSGDKPVVGAKVLARVQAALQARSARFAAIEASLTARIARVEAIADRVEAAGGDVDQARARLSEAERLLEQARDKERVAEELFREVPTATDRRAAFHKAHDAAKAAVADLKAARAMVRETARTLRGVVRQLRTEAGSGDGA